MNNSTVLVEATNVCHSYGKSESLKSVSLTIKQGQCFALLGPNGAGKTTFVKMMLGLQFPKSGTLQLFQQNAHQPSARQSIGYLPEKFSFYPYYKVEETLQFYAALSGISKAQMQTDITHALEQLKIADLAKKKLSNLSKGQLQRVGLSALLLGDKKLIILDEPFSGLDPIGIRDLKELLKRFTKEGRTLFINSHILSEIEPLCDHFGILNKGELVAIGAKSELLKNESLEDFFAKRVQ